MVTTLEHTATVNNGFLLVLYALHYVHVALILSNLVHLLLKVINYHSVVHINLYTKEETIVHCCLQGFFRLVGK